MGPSYVLQLLWGSTLVHKMVPTIIVHNSVTQLWVHLMYSNYCRVLPLIKETNTSVMDQLRQVNDVNLAENEISQLL